MLETLLYVASNAFLYMAGLFLLSIIVKRNDIADVAWGGGFLVVLFSLMSIEDFISIHEWVVIVLVSLWAIRIIWHIGSRKLGESEEDRRYAGWRKEWKFFYLRSFLQVWMLQGALMIAVSMAYIPLFVSEHLARAQWGLTPLLLIGIGIWLLGFIFETVGDWQLRQFLAKPKNKGKLMTSGLWSLTRHPNYFGEVTQWWGIFIISLLGVGFGSILNIILLLIGPITITILILGVSGIPTVEKGREGPEWEKYVANTWPFFPLPRNN